MVCTIIFPVTTFQNTKVEYTEQAIHFNSLENLPAGQTLILQLELGLEYK